MASTITDTTVPPTRPISMPPFTLRATSTPVTSSVRTNMSVGTDATEPPMPRPTGGEFDPVAVTKPELTNPMKAMKRPIATVMASFSCTGTASKMSLRSPVAASSTMMTPLIITRAIASGQVTSWMTLKARNALMPSPAAKANGSRVTRPNRIVMTPAVSAVAAPTAENASSLPAMSALPDRMIGLRITMYAIVTKVTSPPRISPPIVEPRRLISKKRSSAPSGASAERVADVGVAGMDPPSRTVVDAAASAPRAPRARSSPG